MAKPRKAWISSPAKKPTSSLPGTVKDEVETKAKELIETVLKPRFIMPPPPDQRFNYITDVGAKWYRSSYFFFSTYACPGPTAQSPSFESKFARMEHVGNGRFNLSFMRHTGKWVELYDGLTVDECLEAIRDDPWFQA